MTGFPSGLISNQAAGRLCVGIDPHPQLLAEWGLPDSASGLEGFGQIVADAIEDTGVTLAKPQVALFERHGLAGLGVLARLIQRIRATGTMVIADVKRGDIGTSVRGYADAWLGLGSDFESDAMTVVAYQGVGSLRPVLELAKAHRKGVFVLAATSNPEGWPLQSATVPGSGTTVASQICLDLAEYLEGASDHAPGSIGVVVGATVNHVELGLDLARTPALSILAPGFGAQGASLAHLEQIFPESHQRVFPAVSRSVCAGGPGRVAEAIGQHRETLGG